jgi:hypothetical protein
MDFETKRYTETGNSTDEMFMSTPRTDTRQNYRDADKSLARPTSRFILFDGENISFDTSQVIYTNSTNIPPILIINKIKKKQKLL